MNSPAHRLVQKYIRVTRMHRSVMERCLHVTGVYRSQHQILMYVVDNPNASQKEIAKLYGVSTATIAVSLKKLEKGGYIQRMVDEKDNRFNRICITEKGKKVVDDSMKIFHQIETRMFEGFSEEDFKRMEGFFDRVYDNLKEEIPIKTEREDK
ncbi:MAG: MarR family transcriptional regulator [Hungatella sp.]